MAAREKVPMFRPGQVPDGGRYAPIAWPTDDVRFQTLLTYSPNLSAGQWPRLRDTCVDLVMRTGFVDDVRDRERLSALFQFVLWAEDHHCDTAPESLLSGDRIDAFIADRWQGLSTKATMRTRLRHVAAAVFPPAPEMAYPRKEIALVHTDDDLKRFLAATASLVAGEHGNHPHRVAVHREMQVLLALSFGAGANGHELHRVREGWLFEDATGWWLERGRTLPTPLHSRWVGLLVPHLTGDSDAFVLRPHCLDRRNQQVGKVMEKAAKWAPGLQGFTADRASRYWHARMLRAANFDVAIAVGGYKRDTGMPMDMHPNLPLRDHKAALEMVRGWAA